MADAKTVAFDEANDAFRSGDFQRAYDLWTASVESVVPEQHHVLHTNRGAALERLGRLEDSIEAYTLALASKPDHVEALHNRGVSYNALGQLELALDSFTAALEVNPSFYVSWRGKVDTLMQLGRFADAVTAITSALALKPDDMALVTKRGFAYLKLGQPEAAIGEYEAAIAAGDASPETKRLLAAAFSQRALELDKADNVAEAERHYNRSIELEATENRLYNRAHMFMRHGRMADAIVGFREVCRLSSTNLQARAALGTLLLQENEFADAAKYLKEAKALQPSFLDVVFNLGVAYMKQNRLDEAEAEFDDILRQDPTFENARNGAAVVAEMRAAERGVKLEVGEALTFDNDDNLVQMPTVGGSAPAASSSAAAPSAAAGTSTTPAAVAAAPAARVEPAATAAAAVTASRPVVAASAASLASRTTTPVPVGPVVFGRPVPGAGTAAAGPARSESPSARYAAMADGVDGEVYPYTQLKAPGPFPAGIDAAHREAYLSVEEFVAVLGMTKAEFYAAPKWRRLQIRKATGLF